MAFKMKGPMFFRSALKHYVDDVPSHNDPPHYEGLQTDEEHKNGTRTHFPDGTKRSEREIAEYDENKAEEKKENKKKSVVGETGILEEGRTDLAATTEKGPEEEEAALAMKSPMKDRITKYDDSDNEAKLHNKDYENNPNHHQDGTYHKNK